MATMREPTLEELLSDPMMATVLQHARITPDAVRSMMQDAGEWMATARVAEGEQPSAVAAASRA